jgi:hypothetical protein
MTATKLARTSVGGRKRLPHKVGQTLPSVNPEFQWFLHSPREARP